MFDQNDTIPVFTTDSSGSVVYLDASKYMQLPAASDFTHECNDANFIHFEVDVSAESNSCMRQVIVPATSVADGEDNAASLQAQCEQVSSTSKFVDDLLVAT